MATGVSETVDCIIPEEEIHFTETVLGEGAFATVYKATWRGAVVAVKCIRALTYGESPSSEKRKRKEIVKALDVFRKEASASCGLLHPRIVRFFGVYAPATRHVGLVMERMETSLRSRVEKDPALTTPCIVHVLQDMTAALIYLHSRSILHRDISPHNTLLSDDSAERRLIAKLADFATAKAVETITFDHHNSVHTGTISYLPYEAIDKDPVTDAVVCSSAVDVYSVGAVGLFSVLRKEPSGTPRVKPRYLERVGSTHALHGLLKNCLEDDPCKRPSSMKLLADLGRVRVPKPCTCSGLTGRRLQKTAATSDSEVGGSHVTEEALIPPSALGQKDRALPKLHSALEMGDVTIAKIDAAIIGLQVAREELEEQHFIEKVRMYNDAMDSPNCNGRFSGFPQWKSLTTIPLPGRRDGSPRTAVHCDYLYLAFPRKVGSMLVRTNDLKKWDKLQPPTGTLVCHGMLSHNDHFYSLYSLRCQEDDHCVLFELMDVNTEATDSLQRLRTVWKQLPNGRCPIFQYTPAFFGDEQQKHLVFLGGSDFSNNSISDVSEYSLTKKNWVNSNSLPKLPVPRDDASVVFLHNQYHLLGGLSEIDDHDDHFVYQVDDDDDDDDDDEDDDDDDDDDDCSECNSVLSIDATSNGKGIREWKTDAIPPAPVFDEFAACKLFGTIVIAGGTLDGSPESAHSGVYVFDRSGRKWLKLPSMSLPKYGASLICFNDQLLAIGGLDDQEEYLEQAEQLSLKYFDIS